MTEENAQHVMTSLVLLEQKVLTLNDTNAELRAEIERLRGLVERAYREGYVDGTGPARTLKQYWDESVTRAELQGDNMSMLHGVYPWESFEEYMERMGPSIVRTVALRNFDALGNMMNERKFNAYPPTRSRKHEQRKFRNYLKTLASYECTPGRDALSNVSYNLESDGA